MQNRNRIYSKTVEWLWNLLVLALPFTSVPIVSKFTGSSNVAPASGIFMLILLAIWFIPYLFKKGTLAIHTVPLIAFFLFSIFTTLAAFFLYSPAFKNVTVLSSAFKGLATLMLGFAFYVITATILQDRKFLQRTLQMINWGGMAVILWALIQFFVWLLFSENVVWIRFLQGLISTGKLYASRVTGFAIEPSWLAHMLNIVYLPIWLAATIEKTSAHKFRFHGITFENVLLLGGIAVLVLTFSRVGWAAFLLMLLYVFIRLNIRFTKWILGKVSKGKSIHKGKKTLLTVLISAGLIVIYLGVLVGSAYFASKVDIRMEELFTFSTTVDNPLLRYANTLKFGERIVYWMSGWQIFNDYPIIGVGLGNAGFYMPSRLVPYGWSLTEVQRLLFRESGLLNIKSLWFRLPAETGIIGLILFTTWLYVIFRSSRMLRKQSDASLRTIGLMGIFMLIGLIMEGLSIDSFAMPYLWITAGIVTASSVLYLRDARKIVEREESVEI